MGALNSRIQEVLAFVKYGRKHISKAVCFFPLPPVSLQWMLSIKALLTSCSISLALSFCCFGISVIFAAETMWNSNIKAHPSVLHLSCLCKNTWVKALEFYLGLVFCYSSHVIEQKDLKLFWFFGLGYHSRLLFKRMIWPCSCSKDCLCTEKFSLLLLTEMVLFFFVLGENHLLHPLVFEGSCIS